MAANFKYSGKRVTITNISAPVASGTLVRQRGWIGIPQTNGATGQTISFAVEGVWGLTFAAFAGVGAGPLPAVGTILYWDVANAVLSNGCGVNDYPAVKCLTPVSAIDGSFEGSLMSTWDRPKTADQS